MWGIFIETKDGTFRAVDENVDRIANDDPDYGDVHIVPESIFQGHHEFKRDCMCRPEIRIEPDERPMVIHKERPVN